MEFVEGIVDFGIAPEIHVDGIARVEKISAHVVRVSYFARHRACDGAENRIVLHTDWDVENWVRHMDLTKEVRAEVLGPSLVPRMVGTH